MMFLIGGVVNENDDKVDIPGTLVDGSGSITGSIKRIHY